MALVASKHEISQTRSQDRFLKYNSHLSTLANYFDCPLLQKALIVKLFGAPAGRHEEYISPANSVCRQHLARIFMDNKSADDNTCQSGFNFAKRVRE